MIEPIRLTFDVDCPADHAFEVWTARIDTLVADRSHGVAATPTTHVVLEGRAGGRIFERTPSGVEHDWGEVTIWEPPSRLGYLWHLRRDRADATEVEIRFVARGAASTRVEIEHRGWERLGAGGEEQRDRNRGGWATLLPHFVAAATGCVLGLAERSERLRDVAREDRRHSSDSSPATTGSSATSHARWRSPCSTTCW